MITNLTKDQITRGQAMAKALRANKKKTRGAMRDENGGRCCLCVAYDTAQEMGAGLPALIATDGVPPPEIEEWYGWRHYDPSLGGVDASCLNDGTSQYTEKTHKEIADAFEAQFPQLKEGEV